MELELGKVKLELEQLHGKCHAESSKWLQQQMEWSNQINQKVDLPSNSLIIIFLVYEL